MTNGPTPARVVAELRALELLSQDLDAKLRLGAPYRFTGGWRSVDELGVTVWELWVDGDSVATVGVYTGLGPAPPVAVRWAKEVRR